MRHSTLRTVLLAPVALAASAGLAVALVGCSTLDDLVKHQRQKTWDTTAASVGEWHGSADWLPDDGTDVRLVQNSSATVSVLRVDSSAPLAGCVQTTRESGPTLGTDWVGSDWVAATTVDVCGDWVVVPVTGGYLGWTPGSPHELAAAAPSPSSSSSPSSSPFD